MWFVASLWQQKYPPNADHLAPKIVADADLFYLGTNDFKAQGDLLYKNSHSIVQNSIGKCGIKFKSIL